MNLSETPTPTAADRPSTPWYRELTRAHWFVLVVASLGWLFDTMDQQLFNLARRPAIAELLGPGATPAAIAEYSGYATTIFIIGWATGGVYFGILGDRIGRAKTMVYTILLYSLFTGLSVFSVGVWDFSFYRFLTGLGVGGQFAVGVALVAESLPDRARPYALGWLQASSAIGNMMAATAGIILGQMQSAGYIDSAWRAMFLVGSLPALLCIVVFKKLKEPERWQREAKAGAKRGSFGELFSDPRWRYNAIVGMLLAFAGVVGLWGIGFFSFDLFRSVLERSNMPPGEVTFWIGMTSLLQNAGAFFGIYAFTHLTQRIGRRPAFAIAFVAAMLSTAYTFWNLNDLQRHLLDDPADGLLPAGAVRRLRDLPAGALPDAAAQHRHLLLLQRRTVRRRRRSAGARAAHQPRLRGISRADAVCRRDDVPGVPDRAGDGAVHA